MEYVDVVLSPSKSLMIIVDAVLDIFRMESGKLDFEFIPQEYKFFIEETLNKFKNTTDDNAYKFTKNV